MTAVAASLARVNLEPDIEPDVSIIKITFFDPEAAVTYHGLKRGS